MTKRKWKPNLTGEELARLYEIKWTIRERWIGPIEGWEYMPVPMGGDINREGVGFYKSQRAAYNAILKHLNLT